MEPKNQAEAARLQATREVSVASEISCVGRRGDGELGDFMVLHCLTGWIPEVIPLRPAHAAHVWALLRELLPEFRLPPADGEGVLAEELAVPGGAAEPAVEEPPPAPVVAPEPGPPVPASEPPAIAHAKECKKEASAKGAERGTPADRTDGKEGGRRKGKDAEKRRAAQSASVSPSPEEKSSAKFLTVPDKPEVVVFASYRCPATDGESFSVLGRMADAAQKLREAGLSPVWPHLLRVGRTRSCPLAPPPRSPPVPPWKLVRPRKSKALPRDEPAEPEVRRAEQFVEISSLFLDQRLGSTSSAAGSISETEEEQQQQQRGEPQGHPTEPAAERPSASPLPPPEPLSPDAEPSPAAPGPGESPAPQGTGEQSGLAGPADEAQAPRDSSDKSDAWIHFEDFCTAFQSLCIFHKPHTYAFSHGTGDVKIPAATAVTSSSTHLSAPAKSAQAGAEERAPLYLLVDSVGPSQLIVCLSVLPRWGVFGWDESQKGDGDAGAGSLVANHHSWTQPVKYGPAALRIRTSASKASALCLPPGRHVLSLTASAPHGLHLHVCGRAAFTLADEDAVLPLLAKDSCRFGAHALGTARALGEAMRSWGEGLAPPLPLTPHGLLGIDVAAGAPAERHRLQQIVTRSLCHVLSGALSGAVPSDLPFALHALTGDLQLPSITTSSATEGRVGVPPERWGGGRVATSEEQRAAVRVQALWRGHHARRVRDARRPGTAECAAVRGTLGRTWATLEPNAEQLGARLLRHALAQDAGLLERFPWGPDERSRAAFVDFTGTCSEQPPLSWFLLFRAVFRVAEETWLSADLVSAAPRSSLCVVDNDTGRTLCCGGRGGPRGLVRPAAFAPNKSGYTFVGEAESGESALAGGGRWRLRVVSAGAAPPVPEPLTVAFSARDLRGYYVPSEDDLLMRYHMKLGVDQLVSLRVRASVASARLSLALLDGDRTVASATGRGDATVPAAVLRGARRRDDARRAPGSTASSGSKSPVPVNPAPARKSGGGQKAGRTTAASSSASSASSRPPSSLAPAPPQLEAEPRTQTLAAPEPLQVEPEQPAPVYVLEARVLRGSWPLSGADAAFAAAQRDKERAELKLVLDKPEEQPAGTEEPPGPAAQVETPRAGGAGGSSTPKTTRRPKGGDRDRAKQGGGQGGAPGDAQPALEPGRPHWTLRVLSEAGAEEPPALWRDTSLADGARHTKLAWELAEPGRAAKALNARQEFLSKMLAARPPAPPLTDGVTPAPLADGSEGQAPDENCDEPPSARPAEPPTLTFDPSPYFRVAGAEPAPKEPAAAEAPAPAEEGDERRRAEEIRRFRQRRDELVQRREREQKERADGAARLVAIYEQLQAAVREARCRALAPRDAVVERLEEAARLRAAEREARDAALRAQQQPVPSPKAARKRSPKGSAGKKRAQ